MTPPLTADTAHRIAALTAMPDIHDRLIVAEALAWNAALITLDKAITASGAVATVW